MTIDPKHFRAVMGQVPTTVTVVTAIVDEDPVAMVIGSFVSVSLDPPLAGFFCTSTSHTWSQLRRADILGVNVLADRQSEVSTSALREPADRLEGQDWQLDSGAPRIAGTTAWLRLKLDRVISAGDHDFALCSVLELQAASPLREPLIFYGGGYRSLSRAEV